LQDKEIPVQLLQELLVVVQAVAVAGLEAHSQQALAQEFQAQVQQVLLGVA
jgi:hypothetical protein